MPRYALIIGIAHYDKFRNLSKAVTDAGAIATLLRDYGGYIVRPLPGQLNKAENRWDSTPEKKLSAKRLGETLREFLLEQAKDSEALIYFAGHGFEATGSTGEPEGFLAASDARNDGQNAIRFDDLNKLISRSSLKSLVVMLDCCHAGSFLERSLIESSLSAFNTKQNYYLMTACRGFERAREGEEHGVFTEAVLAGLQADHADQSGQISCDRLFDFIANRLRQSGQEPIRTGTGGLINLLQYQGQTQTVEAILDDDGNLVCPYQGLEAFTVKQKDFFFGRQKVVEAIRQRLNQSGFVPVIGASGSGKSSVVRAGLIPWLNTECLGQDEQRWQVLVMKPGVNPISKLMGLFESRLSSKDQRKLETWLEDGETYPDGLGQVIKRIKGDDRFLLVVDQFEEIFTVCANESRRQRFIELIAQVFGLSPRLMIVTTMRADFLEPCLQYPSLHQLIQSHVVFMPPLSGMNLKAVITEPAERQGYQIEEALLLKILEDVGKEPGFLPLLEFALTKLWDKRDDNRYILTLAQYKTLGGLTGALNLYADRVYQYQDHEQDEPCEKRPEQERDWIKRIFLRLVRTGDGAKDTRQRQAKVKLMSIADNLEANPDAEVSTSQELLSELLEDLVNGRLLVAGNDTEEGNWIDLAHEALLGAWERFKEWRSEDRALRRLIAKMEDSFNAWTENKSEGNFLMGEFLEETQRNWYEIQDFLPSPIHAYYRRSVEKKNSDFRKIKNSDRLNRILEVGAEAHVSLLPSSCPKIPDLDLAARCTTANQLGGDYYDFIPIGLKSSNATLSSLNQAFDIKAWDIVIGKVMGKGIPASLLLATIRAKIHLQSSLLEFSPSEILTLINEEMYSDLRNVNRFATLFYSRYVPGKSLMTYCNAAHEPPLVWNQNSSEVYFLDTEGMLIGLDKKNLFKEYQVQLRNNDVVAYFTEGIINSTNIRGERFGIEKLIKSFENACQIFQSSQEILDRVYEELKKFIGNNKKKELDMTFIVLKVKK